MQSFSQIRVHLVSLPWGVKHIPSIQISALKSFLHLHRPELNVTAHHLHLTIPSKAFSEERYWSKVAKNFHEGYFLYLLSLRYGDRFSLPSPEILYEEVKKHACAGRNGFSFLSMEELEELARVTEAQLEERIVKPSQDAARVVIGMTTNFLQTYANVFAYAYLESRLADKKLSFVLGGSSVSYPQVVSTLSRLKLKAHVIVGEGEHKLLTFIDKFTRDEPLEDFSSGVFSLEKSPDLTAWNDEWHRSQVKSFSELPDPDFTEYFEALDQFENVSELMRMRKRVEIPLEGSRGCVFSCEFCNLNRFWQGYRKRPGQEIAQRALKLSRHYGVNRVRFVDNLCDGWARDYAHELNNSNLKLSSMMELRPKHDEAFWEILVKSGLRECQIGVEGLDDDILLRVKKGTTVMDVAFNQKILTEKLVFRGSRQLITYYPKSTVAEVKNTREMLETLLHMPRFDTGGFALGVDSPLYKGLSRETQLKLHVTSDYTSALPKGRDELSVHFYLANPPELTPSPEAFEEWRKLSAWYHEISPAHWIHHYLLIDGNEVRDARSGEEIIYQLPEDVARVYEACHSPRTKNQLISEKNLTLPELETIFFYLREKKLILEKNGQYLALALRISWDAFRDIQQQKFFDISR